MPLRAFVGDREIIAPLLSGDQWRRLQEHVQTRRVHVVLRCCGSAGFLRTSKYGVQHFVHARRGTCAWEPETAEHLALKAAIVRACHAASYSAETEVVGADWRADILAVRGDTRIAFEVQWSTQTLQETVIRQERYARDGIRGCWFFRQAPSGYVQRKDLPLFVVEAQPKPRVIASDTAIPIEIFVRGLLGKHITFHAQVHATRSLSLLFFRVTCPMCTTEFLAYTGQEVAYAQCTSGCHFYPIERLGRQEAYCGRFYVFRNGHDTIYEPDVVALARTFLEREIPGFTLGQLDARVTEMAFACPTCRTAQLVFARNTAYPLIAKLETSSPITGSAHTWPGHWCVPEATALWQLVHDATNTS